MYMASTPAFPAAERTITLLAFEDASQSPLADLMDVTQRQKTASELNAAILSSQCQVCSLSPAHLPRFCSRFCIWSDAGQSISPSSAHHSRNHHADHEIVQQRVEL